VNADNAAKGQLPPLFAEPCGKPADVAIILTQNNDVYPQAVDGIFKAIQPAKPFGGFFKKMIEKDRRNC
jgi:hypothetical protein